MSLHDDFSLVHPSVLRPSHARDPELGSWIRALAMSMLIRRAEAFVGMPMRYGQANHIDELLQAERDRMMRHNEIFSDLPPLNVYVESNSIGLSWVGFPGASLPVPTHSLLWEFLESRMVPGSPKIVLWQQSVRKDVVATIQAMEQDEEGRALLVDFDAWQEKRGRAVEAVKP